MSVVLKVTKIVSRENKAEFIERITPALEKSSSFIGRFLWVGGRSPEAAGASRASSISWVKFGNYILECEP